jgi:hypothetical protein
VNPWECLCCDCEIDADTGRSLDDSSQLHLCTLCWVKMSVAEQLETIRKWRRSKLETETLETIIQVCLNPAKSLVKT